MTSKQVESAVRKMAGMVCAAVVVVGLAQQAGAFGAIGSSANKETCAYTKLLQTSVKARRDYLVKVDEARGTSYTARSSVDDMYGSIAPASYEEESGGLGSIISITLGSSRNAKDDSAGIRLDSFSINCLSCHDGIAAGAVQADLRDRPFDRSSHVKSFTDEHPVGMYYEGYVAADRGYKPAPNGTRMIFVNGRVGCLTCHDPLNNDKGHLVMSDNRSALCMTCHDK